MKILKVFVGASCVMLIPVFAHSENMYEKKPITTIVAKENSVPAKIDTQAQANTGQKAQDGGKVVTQKLCLGDDCRSNWPTLKCSTYEGRPAGETGDAFCGQTNKSCMSVSIGGGQSFFNECSVPANSVHSCRCCWVE